MIKCSKLTLKYSNTEKANSLDEFINEYQDVVRTFVDLLWEQEKIPRLLPKENTSKLNSSWLSKRAIQCAAKQASAIIRGTRKKQKQRQFVYERLVSEGKYKQARKLKNIIDETNISKPNVKSLELELDSRFVTLDWDNATSFDGWLTLSSFGKRLKIKLPVRKSKHFNWLCSRGKLKSGVRLSKNMATFNFEIPTPAKKDSGVVLGIDIGSTNAITCSNGFQSKQDKHGWDLSKIQNRLSKRKKGSQGFRKAQQHRTNYVNWSINQLCLKGVKKLRIENIKHLRRGHKSSRKLSHWAYTAIFDKLEDICSTSGVQMERVNPAYTSQRCSQCGWVRKSNRQGQRFKCKSCFYESDADLNASKNICLELPVISKAQRLKRENRKGFYWNVLVQEFIVLEALNN